MHTHTHTHARNLRSQAAPGHSAGAERTASASVERSAGWGGSSHHGRLESPAAAPPRASSFFLHHPPGGAGAASAAGLSSASLGGGASGAERAGSPSHALGPLPPAGSFLVDVLRQRTQEAADSGRLPQQHQQAALSAGGSLLFLDSVGSNPRSGSVHWGGGPRVQGPVQVLVGRQTSADAPPTPAPATAPAAANEPVPLELTRAAKE
jgi:hypothetical protein